MIRLTSRGAAGDPEMERRRQETEKQAARMMTLQNVILFAVTCGILRVDEYRMKSCALGLEMSAVADAKEDLDVYLCGCTQS
ncbi:hypothetical protein BaRGS_00022797 [Batillaria attramentaria]|uniref:Uncharacterized protein n=1 Tax=Batillaria attramentaria TaxID=370345 RepID=A0ABD0KG50_9CAEN